MECIVTICVRDAEKDYCKKHLLAKDNIDTAFPNWQEAYGKKFTKKQYLERLSEDYEVGAGNWVIEVAEHLLSE